MVPREPVRLEALSEIKITELKVILKADFRGSIEAITKELEKLRHEEVAVRVLHSGIGAITESDVQLAVDDTGVTQNYVLITVGGTVKWTNNGTTPHTATTQGNAPLPFDTGGVGPRHAARSRVREDRRRDHTAPVSPL